VQGIDLITLAYFNAHTRNKLPSAITYYISPTGSDTTGDGTSGNPWATLQHACRLGAAQHRFCGQQRHDPDGGRNLHHWSLSLRHNRRLDRSTASSGGGGIALVAAYSGVLQVSNVIFGPSSSANQMYAIGGGQIVVDGDYSITGGAQYHVQAAAFGYVQLSSSPWL
jgi:hypothetical protein